MISVLILTYNEERHILRCLASAKQISDDIHIIDSYSTDKTLDYVLQEKCNYIQRKFTTQSDQINWGLKNVKFKYDWVFRLDADEYLSPKLEKFIRDFNFSECEYNGIEFLRKRYFDSKLLNYAGKSRIVRCFKLTESKCSSDNMDEYIIVNGEILKSNLEFYDHSLISQKEWIQKHVNYSFREIADLNSKRNLSKKKEIYYRLPRYFRVILLVLYELIFKKGLIDGKNGVYWINLQVFWYRWLIDSMIRGK